MSKIIPHREITRTNWVIQVCLTQQECQESLIQEKIHIEQNSNKDLKYKLSFRELCDAKLSGLHSFDMVIINWVKYWSKTERYAVTSSGTNPWSNFCDPYWKLICHDKWHPGTSEKYTPPEIAVGTHFHAWHGNKNTLVFLPADGEASWLLHPSSVSLLSGSTVPPENIYFCILHVTGQVWESQKG